MHFDLMLMLWNTVQYYSCYHTKIPKRVYIGGEQLSLHDHNMNSWRPSLANKLRLARILTLFCSVICSSAATESEDLRS